MDAEELMVAEQGAGLAAAIEELLRSTSGVQNLYRSGSLFANVVGEGAAVLGLRPEAVPLVTVSQGEDGVSVEAALGIDAAVHTGETLRLAHRAIDGLLAANGLARDRIRLTVVHVRSPEAS